MTRLVDRWLRRATYPGGYNENFYTGAEYAPIDGTGRGREGSSAYLVRQARGAYAANGIVFAAMAVRQMLFSEARFQFQALTDMHTFGDTSLSLLEHPWPNTDTGELLSRMQLDGSLGNAYFRKAVPADGGPAELVQMRPEAVTIISQERVDDMGRTWRRPIGYAEDISGGQGTRQQIFTTDEVAHFSPFPDPKARWRGMSWLTPILAEVHSDSRLTEYRTWHLDNGAFPGLVIKYSQKLGNRTIDSLRKRIKGRYGGPENAGNVIVLDEGADMTVAGSTLEQLQHDAVTKAGERRVCAAAGPGMLVICGFEQGDYKTAIREFADLLMRPQWRMACASLAHLIPGPASNPQVPVRLWYDVSGIAALREGELERSQAFLVTMQGVASGVAAGFERTSAVQAAAAGDVSLLKPDPNAPTPGMAGRVTESEKFGAPGGTAQPPTGGPAGGLPGRPPQAGRPQQLPGVGSPNLPPALPGMKAATPALPAGARGSANGKAKRSVDVDGDEDGPPGEVPG